MSLYLEGVPVPSAAFSGDLERLFLTFFATLPRARSDADNLLLTTVVPPYGSFSVALPCVVEPLLSHDIALGIDWAVYLRETFLGLDIHLDNMFDRWLFFIDPSRRLSGDHPYPTSSLVSIDTRSLPGHILHRLQSAPRSDDNAGSIAIHSANDVSPVLLPPVLHRLCAYSPFTSLLLHVPASASDIVIKPFFPIVPQTPSGPSHSPAVSDTADSDKAYHDEIGAFFLSPNAAANIFRADPPRLIKMMDKHHIQRPTDQTISGARHALIAHILSGSCIGSCDPLVPAAHISLSVLLSAPTDMLPDTHVAVVSQCFGWSDDTREHLFEQLSSRRRLLVENHSVSVPARTVFSNAYDLPRGSLLSVAQSHGLRLPDHLRNDIIRDMLLRHDQFKALANETVGNIEDPSIRMQVNILCQVALILKIHPLRRILELHSVSYVESGRTKKLLRKLQSHLHRSVTGKLLAEDEIDAHSPKAARRRESSRLRSEWPKLILNHLKKRLVEDFHLEISAANQSTFICGSCWEDCPILQPIRPTTVCRGRLECFTPSVFGEVEWVGKDPVAKHQIVRFGMPRGTNCRMEACYTRQYAALSSVIETEQTTLGGKTTDTWFEPQMQERKNLCFYVDIGGEADWETTVTFLVGEIFGLWVNLSRVTVSDQISSHRSGWETIKGEVFTAARQLLVGRVGSSRDECGVEVVVRSITVSVIPRLITVSSLPTFFYMPSTSFPRRPPARTPPPTYEHPPPQYEVVDPSSSPPVRLRPVTPPSRNESHEDLTYSYRFQALALTIFPDHFPLSFNPSLDPFSPSFDPSLSFPSIQNSPSGEDFPAYIFPSPPHHHATFPGDPLPSVASASTMGVFAASTEPRPPATRRSTRTSVNVPVVDIAEDSADGDSEPEPPKEFEIVIHVPVAEKKPAGRKKTKSAKVDPLTFGPTTAHVEMEYDELMGDFAKALSTLVIYLERSSMKWKFVKPANSIFLPLRNASGLKSLVKQIRSLPKSGASMIIVQMDAPVKKPAMQQPAWSEPAAGPSAFDTAYDAGFGVDNDSDDGGSSKKPSFDAGLEEEIEKLMAKYTPGICSLHPTLPCFHNRSTDLHYHLTRPRLIIWAAAISQKRGDASLITAPIGSKQFNVAAALKKVGAARNEAAPPLSQMPTTPLPPAPPFATPSTPAPLFPFWPSPYAYQPQSHSGYPSFHWGQGAK
ncbi:hypothetical protein C8R43DRAFT_956165 [Mycena crocata]|nr:hypothetical protein C8R43DRAFT_956165 [Mycena crocata]